MEEEEKKRPVPAIPLNYYNGFAINPTPADMQIVFTFNGVPMECVSMSHISMKNLANKLVQTIAQHEQQTGIKIPEFDEITKKFREFNK